MTEATVIKKVKNPKPPKLFPDELIDQPLAHGQSIARQAADRRDVPMRCLRRLARPIRILKHLFAQRRAACGAPISLHPHHLAK